MVRWVMVGALCCATGVAQAQDAVRVVKDTAMVSGCRRLAEVRGSSVLSGIMASAGYDNALNEMKEKTAASGGNHLLLLDLSKGTYGSDGFGEAYRCDDQPQPAPKRQRR